MTRGLALFAGLAAVCGLAAAEFQDVPAALAKAVHAGPHLCYVGKRIVEFQHNGKADRHTEIVYRSGKWTRIEFPAGSRFAGQIIVEGPSWRKHFFPDRNTIEVSPPRREETYARLVRMVERGGSRMLKFATGSPERVAGRDSTQVMVLDGYGNLVQKMFIDPSTGAVLKRSVFDKSGSPVGFFEFESFVPKARLGHHYFELVHKGAQIVTPTDKLSKIAAENGFDFAMLPASTGYALEHSQIAHVEGQAVLMETYSSSKGRLSLFELPPSLDSSSLKHFNRRDFQIYSWQSGGRTYAIVGRAGQEGLDRLAASLGPGTG